MKKMNRKILCFILAIFCFSLTSCYKQEKFVFQEGKYQYLEEDFYLYDKENLITDLYIILGSYSDAIDENTSNSSDENIIINRKNDDKYHLDIVFTFEDNTFYKCKFKMYNENGKVGDQIDRYYIELDVSDMLNSENAKLLMFLEFDAPYDYENKVQPTIASEIYVQFKYFVFNDNSRQDTLCQTIVKLELVN